LLAQGEAALARSDAQAAEQHFDSAANILHAADTEMGLVRTYMQQGQYRRALAFGSHTAGAHLDVVGGSALYAWLLHVGGQGAFAQRLLNEAQARSAKHPLLAAVQKQLQSATPLATGVMLQPPVRLAPYSAQAGVPQRARVLGTGVLLGDGARVLAPIATLGRAPHVWVRNGLGQLARARVEQRLQGGTLAVLRLAQPLPPQAPLVWAPTDAFPGSVAFTVEYVASVNAAPAWPVLHTGFVGGPTADGKARQLGITLAPGARGGPVFDDGGRLVGLAIRAPGAADQLVMASELRRLAGTSLGSSAATPAKQRVSVDQIYESALQMTVQIIAVR
jgi:hypothetical protein